MTKIRFGGYIFVTWIGDHPPRHVHIYRDGSFVVKWDLDRDIPMQGDASRRLRALIDRLRAERQL